MQKLILRQKKFIGQIFCTCRPNRTYPGPPRKSMSTLYLVLAHSYSPALVQSQITVAAVNFTLSHAWSKPKVNRLAISYLPESWRCQKHPLLLPETVREVSPSARESKGQGHLVSKSFLYKSYSQRSSSLLCTS